MACTGTGTVEVTSRLARVCERKLKLYIGLDKVQRSVSLKTLAEMPWPRLHT